MVRKWTRWAVVAATVAMGGMDVAGSRVAQAEGQIFPRPQYDLFYNYYVNGDSGVPAQMYPAPRPTPPFVGHTYFTYQPFLPHEFLYPHSRVYRRYNRPHGILPVNTTRVSYW
jgi:hypothetical protein